MAVARYVAKLPQPLQRGALDWPHFTARIYAPPLLLLAVPYRRDKEGQVLLAQKDGTPGDEWPKACKQKFFNARDPSWSALTSGDGWRYVSDLHTLGFDPQLCDGAVVLFVVEAYKNSLFDADVPTGDVEAEQKLDDQTLHELIEALTPAGLQQAATRWPAASASTVGKRGQQPQANPAEMALVACRYPAGVLDRTPGPSTAAAQRLAAWLAQQPLQRLLVMTGDSIYIDATAGLFDPAVVPATGVHGDGKAGRALTEALKAAYREADQRNPHFGNARARLQSLDDHELIDNWEPSANPPRNRMLEKRLAICHQAFKQSSAREGIELEPPGLDCRPLLYYSEQVDGLQFFIADTRTEREPRDPRSLQRARIMSRTQFGRLLRWLRPLPQERGRAYRRVVVSPSMLLPRRLSTQEDDAAALRSDAWDGYPASLHAMLAAVSLYPGLRCVFLSGDEHLPCVLSASVQRIESRAPASRLLSVHAGALYAPWPFANSRREDFADEPGFDFDSNLGGRRHRYRCTIDALQLPPRRGDGFVTLAYPAGADVEPTVCWHAAEGGC